MNKPDMYDSYSSDLAANPEPPEAETWSSAPLHFTDKHFTAVTIDNRKFVYCPVGNIVSWSEGDYNHKWCEWCKKSFEEIAKS